MSIIILQHVFVHDVVVVAIILNVLSLTYIVVIIHLLSAPSTASTPYPHHHVVVRTYPYP